MKFTLWYSRIQCKTIPAWRKNWTARSRTSSSSTATSPAAWKATGRSWRRSYSALPAGANGARAILLRSTSATAPILPGTLNFPKILPCRLSGSVIGGYGMPHNLRDAGSEIITNSQEYGYGHNRMTEQPSQPEIVLFISIFIGPSQVGSPPERSQRGGRYQPHWRGRI